MNNEIDHDYTDEIVCPYCGYKVRDSHDVSGNNEDGDYECDECGKRIWGRYHYMAMDYAKAKQTGWKTHKLVFGERICETCRKINKLKE